MSFFLLGFSKVSETFQIAQEGLRHLIYFCYFKKKKKKKKNIYIYCIYLKELVHPKMKICRKYKYTHPQAIQDGY